MEGGGSDSCGGLETGKETVEMMYGADIWVAFWDEALDRGTVI